VLQAARELDLTVPRQLSVVGTDDIPVAAHTTPPLTTVQQLFVDKGREAARLLIAGETAATTLLAVRLIERSSTAPPDPDRPG
jgi:DNA-binding LacI/PurR family transcriptional regulator